MDDNRYNSPHTSMIQFEVFGEQLQIAQDPNSKHLGTTVWDASMVFVKFLEKNCRKGQFSPPKLKGKRVIELGAGCGLAGFGMALLGCDVLATDQTEVLPLLMRNVERNTVRIKQANAENPYSVSFGSIQVAELDWGNQHHIAAVDPPFDYIIGTDIVYVEHLLEPLLKTILSLSGPRTTVLLGYELRSTVVHEKMNELWKENFAESLAQRRKGGGGIRRSGSFVRTKQLSPFAPMSRKHRKGGRGFPLVEHCCLLCRGIQWCIQPSSVKDFT